MARNTEGKRVGVRIAMFSILIVALLIGVFFWFEYLGLLSRSALPAPIANLLLGRDRPPTVDGDDQLLLEKERLAKREQAVERLQEELDRRERGVVFQEQQITTQEQELLAFESQIDEREKSLISERNRYENEREVLIVNVQQLTAMRPQDAVSILEEYEDQLLVDTFQVAQEIADEQGVVSLVPLWLSLLPPDRASAVQRKTVIKYGN